jgi:CTP synthase
MVEDEGLDEYVMSELGITDAAVPKEERQNEWRDIVTQEKTGDVDVALVGKYALEDAYISIHESLKHAGFETNTDINVLWIDADEINGKHAGRLERAEGIIVPGGFGARGTEGKIDAVQYAREDGVPFLGLCLGFQMAVVEFARHVCGFDGAHSAEMEEATPHPVIDILPEQYEVEDMGGTMRLGAHETDIEPGTLAHDVYDDTSCTERHRHRYEVNPEYIEELEEGGMVFSGRAGNRMEILELPEHPFFFGTQFHPEFRSRPGRASPPFLRFVETVLKTSETDREEVTA